MARLFFAAALAVTMALLVLLAHPAAAHTPDVTKSTLKSSKTKFTIVGLATTLLPAGQDSVGDRLVMRGDVKADGHGQFKRSTVCTLAAVDGAASSYVCQVETAFAKGSVVSQGTLVLASGVYTGSLSIIGGNGVFKSVRGIEAVAYTAATNAGTIAFSLS
jgi:hypothetical protein